MKEGVGEPTKVVVVRVVGMAIGWGAERASEEYLSVESGGQIHLVLNRNFPENLIDNYGRVGVSELTQNKTKSTPPTKITAAPDIV